jgi:hypothetical protein
VDEVHVKLYLQVAEAGYIPATSELNKGILPNWAVPLQCFIARMPCSFCEMCLDLVFSDIVEGMWKVCLEKDSVGVEG